MNAAANLNISQTAVSARIRVLEEQLDRPMFIRNKAGARLTPPESSFSVLQRAWCKYGRRREPRSLCPGARGHGDDRCGAQSVGSTLEALAFVDAPRMPQRGHSNLDRQIRAADGTRAGRSLDAAVLYGAPNRPGTLAELFREKLVLVRTTARPAAVRTGRPRLASIGGGICRQLRAAFRAVPSPVVAISYGPLLSDYILAVGGSGYFSAGLRSALSCGRQSRARSQTVRNLPTPLISFPQLRQIGLC